MSAAYIPSPVADPAALPDWLETDVAPLDAVMAYPAEQIAAALDELGTTDLPRLLGYLTPEEAS